jgi:hypothetical protein
MDGVHQRLPDDVSSRLGSKRQACSSSAQPT